MTMKQSKQVCILFLIFLIQMFMSSSGLNSPLPKIQFPQFQFSFPNLSPQSSISSKSKTKAKELEDELIVAIKDQGSRLANSDRIDYLVSQLESMRDATIPEPAIAPSIYGRWRLLYTTNADTSSPIQRNAVDAQAFPIYQDIVVNENNQLVVKQVVEFSDSFKLSVDALASTAAYPLPELTNRKSTGKILGFNILGVSLVGEEAEPDPERPNSRIAFVFDDGTFVLNNGKITIPYPVPFRLPFLRDLVKGWLDVSYMSQRLRVSRGNKGTTFVLLKEE
jgi:hypothetical protein